MSFGRESDTKQEKPKENSKKHWESKEISLKRQKRSKTPKKCQICTYRYIHALTHVCPPSQTTISILQSCPPPPNNFCKNTLQGIWYLACLFVYCWQVLRLMLGWSIIHVGCDCTPLHCYDLLTLLRILLYVFLSADLGYPGQWSTISVSISRFVIHLLLFSCYC